MKDPQQGSPFSTGRGRGFEIPERKQPAFSSAERGRPIEIDLGNLNQPGRGPVNYEPAKGTDFDQPLRQGGPDGDADGDLNIA